MALTGYLAQYELLAFADVSSVNTTGDVKIGTPINSITYDADPDIAYSLSMLIEDGETLTLDLTDASVTGEITGTNQVETATVVAAAGITGNGNATCVFTSPLVTGSPLTVSVAVTTALTTATLVAGAIRTALQAETAITDHYTIGGTGATITATAIEKAANDATLNISTANGTCTGITTAATSVDTTAGVGATIATRLNGLSWNQTDFQGETIPTATKLYAVLIRSSTGSVIVEFGANIIVIGSGGVMLASEPSGSSSWLTDPISISAPEGALLYIDIHAGT
jgi:hypothetical protein